MRNMLLVLAALAALGVMLSIAVTAAKPFSRRRGAVGPGIAIFAYIAALAQLFICILSYRIYSASISIPAGPGVLQESTSPTDASDPSVAETEETILPPATEDPRLSFQPTGSASANPENFEISWEIIAGDEIVESYTREEPISFGPDGEYFALPGVATFRGNNHRSDATYGTAEVVNSSLSIEWKHQIGKFNDWGGCAWTGQPLVVQWDAETKAIMDTMYDSKKEKEGLVEVIYATLDGNIHFYDMEDGTQTRDPIFVGMNFKGAGALDPRGYPLLYVGSGLYLGKEGPRMYVVSLIDGSILYEYGDEDPFAARDWTAFDSSPLVDADTDTLIWPAESGLLYTIKLNTAYDKAAGTISVNPDAPVRSRYTSWYSEEDDRYLGYEASAVVVDNYLFTSENGGLFHCIDLNTMELVWAQDTKDDSNSSPLFSWEDGKGYLYTAPSLHWTVDGYNGVTSVYKLDAATGEIIWEYPFECRRLSDVAGGVQASPLTGREGSDIENMVIYSLARTPNAWKGKMVAFDKATGEVVWETETGNYAWSSPTAFYTEDGKAYIFNGNASGVCRLIDGATGEVLTVLDLGQTIEASPVIFNDMMVIGTREAVYGMKIS